MGRSISRLTPRIINTLFIVCLQKYFAQHREYRWFPENSRTHIAIKSDFVEDDSAQEALPLIIVQNGPTSLRAAGVSTGLYHHYPQPKMVDGKLVFRQAVRDYKLQMLLDSYTNIMIITQSKDDADELAFEVATILMCMRPVIAEILQVQNINDMQITPAQQMTQVGWSGKYQASINAPYTATLSRFTWPVEPGELLKTIDTDTYLKDGEEAGGTGSTGDPGDTGDTGDTGAGSGDGSGGNTGGSGDTGDTGDEGTEPSTGHRVGGLWGKGWMYIRFKITKDEIYGYQPDQPW